MADCKFGNNNTNNNNHNNNYNHNNNNNKNNDNNNDNTIHGAEASLASFEAGVATARSVVSMLVTSGNNAAAGGSARQKKSEAPEIPTATTMTTTTTTRAISSASLVEDDAVEERRRLARKRLASVAMELLNDEVCSEAPPAKALRRGAPSLSAKCSGCSGQLQLCVGGKIFEADRGLLAANSEWFAAALELLPAQGKDFPYSSNNNSNHNSNSNNNHNHNNINSSNNNDSNTSSLFIDRDWAHFQVISDVIHVGLSSVLRSIRHLDRCERAALLEEASFYRLPELIGALAWPSIGSTAKVRLASQVLAAGGLLEPIHHDTCGACHVPGVCRQQPMLCGTLGTGVFTGIVVGYRHSEGT
ncbi:unnamed protein product, partial [Polarella glacialis]